MTIKILDKTTFIISLDVELIWGYISEPTHKAISLMKGDDKKGRSMCIPYSDEIEDLMRKFVVINVHEKYAGPSVEGWKELVEGMR